MVTSRTPQFDGPGWIREDLGFWTLGFGVWGLEFRVWGFGVLGLRVQGFGLVMGVVGALKALKGVEGCRALAEVQGFHCLEALSGFVFPFCYGCLNPKP